MVLFFWTSKCLKLVGVFPFRLWWKVTENFVNRAKKFGWLCKNSFQKQSFKKHKIPPTHVCCLLIKETFLKILGPLVLWLLAETVSIFVWSCNLKEKKKTEKNRQWTLLKVLVYKDSQFNKTLNYWYTCMV